MAEAQPYVLVEQDFKAVAKDKTTTKGAEQEEQKTLAVQTAGGCPHLIIRNNAVFSRGCNTEAQAHLPKSPAR